MSFVGCVLKEKCMLNNSVRISVSLFFFKSMILQLLRCFSRFDISNSAMDLYWSILLKTNISQMEIFQFLSFFRSSQIFIQRLIKLQLLQSIIYYSALYFGTSTLFKTILNISNKILIYALLRIQRAHVLKKFKR